MILSGPPQVAPPNPAIFAAMGEENMTLMLEDFYKELAKSSISSMFPKDMITASRKSAAFFIGLCGGPPLYHQLYGHPRLRARHLPFPIDKKAQEEWMNCFRKILTEPSRYNFPEEHLPGFLHFLEEFSPWMINKN